MRTRARHLRMAWLEYQDTRDGAVFAHAAVARLGFENAFSLLPRGDSRSTRRASNLVDTQIRVRAFEGKSRSFRGLIGQPGPDDKATLEKWVSSPAVEGDTLVSDSAASHPIDLLVVSGHGSSGVVWGDGAGDWAQIELAEAFDANLVNERSGGLKCVIVASCNNVQEDTAPLWLPMFNHPRPVYLLLGYERSYTGGAIGAHVMARFVDVIAKNRKVPLIEAWREANETGRSPQPWAALVARGVESMSLEGWIAGDLPVLTKVHELDHYNGEHTSGRRARLVDDRFDVRWVMANGTVIDMTNNLPSDSKIGLFAGQGVKIRLEAKKAGLAFRKGQEVYLFVYYYRVDKKFDITDLLDVDPGLLVPHPDTGKAVVTLERGRTMRTDDVDALKIVVPANTQRVELNFTVRASAPEKFEASGPSGTHGRFLLHFVFDYDFYEDAGQEMVEANDDGDSYAATAGAFLRRSP